MTRLGAEIPLNIEQGQGADTLEPASPFSDFDSEVNKAELRKIDQRAAEVAQGRDRANPLDLLANAIDAVTGSREGYGVPGMADLEPHSSAHLSCSIFNAIMRDLRGESAPQMDVESFYLFEQAQKLARTIAANQRGEMHLDSLLDIGGYASLSATLHSEGGRRYEAAVRDREHQLKCE